MFRINNELDYASNMTEVESPWSVYTLIFLLVTQESNTSLEKRKAIITIDSGLVQCTTGIIIITKCFYQVPHGAKAPILHVHI